jgi:ascorbate-specific PTS system EIIC-type component UlaA
MTALGILLAVGGIASAGYAIFLDTNNDTPILVGFSGTILGIVLLGIGAAFEMAEAENKFMAERRQERKEYECTAMWRAGNRNTTVMPMPIVVPVR